MVQLFLETGEKDCKKILNQWFKDQETSWELYNFLDRIGAKPDSQNVDDLMRALMRVRITDKFMTAVKLRQPFTLSFIRTETGETITKEVETGAINVNNFVKYESDSSGRPRRRQGNAG